MTFGIALVLYLVVWGGVKGVPKACTTDPVVTSDDTLKSETLTRKAAVGCAEDGGGVAACELPDIQAMLNFILVNGVTNCIQLVFSVTLAYSFRRFTDLPQEELQYGKGSRTISCLGMVCKKGPWVTRLLHFVQMFALWVLWGLIMDSKCRGDLSMTASCESYASDCAYFQLKNCQYFYTFCQEGEVPNEELELTCFTEDGRKSFSGLMDIRLTTSNECARCEILRADSTNPDTDEFRLLNNESKGTAGWRCKGDTCFQSNAWANICTKCTDTVRPLVDFENAEVANWWNTVCAAARRMDDTEQWGDDEGLLSASEPLAQHRELERNLAPEEQGCSWAPDLPSYYYSEERCAQVGSFVFRYSTMYCYLSGCLCALLTVVGQAVRITSRPEPWFCNPNEGTENIIKRILRRCGP